MGRHVALPESLSTGPFSVAEALEAGAGYGRLRGHDLDRPFHGVRARSVDTSVLGRALAFVPRMESHWFFCSVTAAALNGIPLPLSFGSGPLHVAAPNPHRAPRARGVIGHKFMIDPHIDLRSWRGASISSPARTWCELSLILSEQALVAAGDSMIGSRGLCSLEDLAESVARYPGRERRAVLERAFPLLDGRAESPKESELRVLLIRHGLDGFVPNVEVVTPEGQRYRLDLACAEKRVVLEFQGGYHNDDRQWKSDMTRRARLESMGWTVIFINSEDLRDPAELVARIRRAMSNAGDGR